MPPSVQLPTEFLSRLMDVLPPEQQGPVLASFMRPRPVTFRVNLLRASPAGVASSLQAQGLQLYSVPWYDQAFILASGDLRQLQATREYQAGLIYVQGLSSMAVALCLDPRPGEMILDMTAAPGSKTTQLVSMVGGQARIMANDRSRDRFFRMKANLEHQGCINVETTSCPGEQFGRTHPHAFDKVLLDAPCSGEGRFSTLDPDSFSDWKLSKVQRLGQEQVKLLRSAWRAVKPGGTLVYSTCTFAPEENELVLAQLMKTAMGGVVLEPIALPIANRLPGLASWKGRALPTEVSKAVRIIPDGYMRGFFIARLRKLG